MASPSFVLRIAICLQNSPKSFQKLKRSDASAARAEIKDRATRSASEFPPGEHVAAVFKVPDGIEEGITQTLTSRSHAGKRTTTVFTWTIRESYTAELLGRVRHTASEQHVGKPIQLVPGTPVVLYSVTNQDERVFKCALEFSPVQLGPEKGEASVRLVDPRGRCHYGH